MPSRKGSAENDKSAPAAKLSMRFRLISEYRKSVAPLGTAP